MNTMMLSFIAALLLCSCERPANGPDTGSGTVTVDRESIEAPHTATTVTLNVSSDCDWGGYRGVDESCLPQTFEIDYVRVFQKAR